MDYLITRGFSIDTGHTMIDGLLSSSVNTVFTLWGLYWLVKFIKWSWNK